MTILGGANDSLSKNARKYEYQRTNGKFGTAPSSCRGKKLLWPCLRRIISSLQCMDTYYDFNCEFIIVIILPQVTAAIGAF
jgi:hypothetical protein